MVEKKRERKKRRGLKAYFIVLLAGVLYAHREWSININACLL